MVNDNDLTEAFETFVDERLEDAGITRRTLLRRGVLAGAGLSALPVLLSQVGPAMAASGRVEAGTPLATLIAAAQKEGTINTITLPPTWANYGEIMKTYQKKYKMKLTDAIPDGTSAQENQAIISNKGSKRAPDVLDVGPLVRGHRQEAEALPAVQERELGDDPGQPEGPERLLGRRLLGRHLVRRRTWTWRRPRRRTGPISRTPPTRTWSRSAATRGRPERRSPPCSQRRLRTAARSTTSRRASSSSPTSRQPATSSRRRRPRRPRRAARPRSWPAGTTCSSPTAICDKGKVNVQVTVPKNGVYGGYYCQAINKYAPHPNAAQLWQEFLYSDAGQLLWLKGYTHPARFQDMSQAQGHPGSLLAKLPPAQDYKTVKFASLSQTAAATTVLAAQWGPKVLGQ